MIKIIPYLVFLVFPSLAITTIHHDKPERARISEMVNTMRANSTTTSERHKRLLPYINYYNNYQHQLHNQQEKFTPFLDSNALPGPFTPIINPQKNFHQEYIPKSPSFGSIYDKFAQLKLQINKTPYMSYRKPEINYEPVHPAKTIIETYTPTNIDISENDKNNYNIIYNKPQYVAVESPRPFQQSITNNYFKERRPVIFLQRPEKARPVFYTVRKTKPVTTIVDDTYEAQKYNVQDYDVKYSPVKFIQPVREEVNYPPVEFTAPQPAKNDVTYPAVEFIAPQPVKDDVTYPPVEFTTPEPEHSGLTQILKELQNTNTLPHTFTPENIDNSIKTLVKILNTLKGQQKLLASKPLEVPEENHEENEYEEGTITQKFPENTVEGGTPGRPGVDYPALSTIPQTDFRCKKQRYKGFFGDPNTNCQVWHYCDLNGGQASFLCPNGTIFSQVALTCDWWYNVKCSSTPQLYVLNERLYKYILPLTPKFPEDYTGPLVDKYLALKFQEMEEKMKKEKKKDDKEEEKDDSDQLQEINEEIQNQKDKKLSEGT